MNLLYLLKGIAIGLIITTLTYMIVLKEHQNLTLELTHQLVQSEIDNSMILTMAQDMKVACEANIEITLEKEKVLREAVYQLGLGEPHVKNIKFLEFQESRIILSQRGE